MMALFLDLDDTIFPTRSIDPNLFAPVFTALRSAGENHYPARQLEQLLDDLWERPFDVVAAKYAFPQSMYTAIRQGMQELNGPLAIEVFPDYKALKKINHSQYLVTSGFPKLQQLKINSLGIRADFKSIHIDDPLAMPRNDKRSIFAELIHLNKLNPTECWVIGDNPDSEIAAGKYLGMKTIWVNRKGETIKGVADYEIPNFIDLEMILNKTNE